MPVFYLGLMLLTVFAARLRWFPVGGYGETFVEHLYHLFLPALTLALSFAAVLMRNLRASIIEVLGAEYVDFARAKGLRAADRAGSPRAAQRADLDRDPVRPEYRHAARRRGDHRERSSPCRAPAG